MRINPVFGFRTQVLQNRKLDNNQQITKTNTAAPVVLSFTGENIKLRQAASITPENMGLGLKEAYQGGEGAVGFEMIKSWRDREKVDARNFMPFWEHDNPKGGFKFLIHRETDYPEGFAHSKALEKGELPVKDFYSAELGETLADVAKKLNIKMSELSYVIQSKPDGKGLSKFCILEPTSVNFDVVRPSDRYLGEMQKVPFALFKISNINPKYNKIKGEPHYFYYTPALAKTPHPYSYEKLGDCPFYAEIINSDGIRGLTKAIHSMMNTEEFGNFNPANVILHDRIAHPYATYVSNMSAAGENSVDGIKYHLIEHNPARFYQGLTEDPFHMLTVVGDEKDIQALKASRYYPILQKAKELGIDSNQLSPREQKIAKAIIEPALAPFRDRENLYNMLRTGIAAAEANPNNVSVGTVSYTFADEMKNFDMADTAKGLTEDFAKLKTKDVLNGCMPSSMELDNPDALFGQDQTNGLYKNRAGFKPFKYNGDNIEEIVAAREKNAKWLSNLIWDAGEKGQHALNELFFSEGQIKAGCNVQGYISPVKDGDVVVMSWGRATEQKGYPIAVKGLLKYFKRKDIPTEEKQKLKLIVGCGTWAKDDSDYKNIMSDLKEIQELDGGKFKNNAMLVDGWFSKRLVACANYGIFTSRREICGLTPLEAKAAGVPSGVTNTGGPADYTNKQNGFLTKNPVEENAEKFGLDSKSTYEAIDKARVERSSDEVVEIYDAMVKEYNNDKTGYIARCKKNIDEKIDWHENSEYNHGKSANQRYLEDICEINKPVESRNYNPMKRIMKPFGNFQEEVETVVTRSGNSKPLKVILGIITGLGTLASLYFIMKPDVKLNKNEDFSKIA